MTKGDIAPIIVYLTPDKRYKIKRGDMIVISSTGKARRYKP